MSDTVRTAAARPGKKVGRKPAFTADDVVAAAIAEGVDRFTLAAVAARLGVVTAAIYRVFGSREEIIVACLDAIGATFRLPADDADWRAVLRLWADESWRLCEQYPGLTRVVYAYPLAFTRIEGVIDAYARALQRDDWTSRQAAFALDFVGDTVFASHLGVEAMRSVDDRGATGLDRLTAAVGADAVMRPTPTWSDRGALDAKLDFILDGLADRRPEL